MPDIIDFDEPVLTAPRFDLRLRGYARDQVDDFLDRLNDRHQRSIEQYETALQEALAQLDRVQSDRERLIAALAAPVTEPSAVSCRVEAIFAAAHAEATQITDQATAVLRKADEQAVTARRDFEIALAARRREQAESAATPPISSTEATPAAIPARTEATVAAKAEMPVAAKVDTVHVAKATPKKSARKAARRPEQHPAAAG